MDTCLICYGKTKVFCKKDGFLIYQCSSCGFGATEGSESAGSAYHRDDVYVGGREQFINIFKRRTNLIKKYARNPGKVLEIGSSTGALLSILKKEGWEVLGIEASSKTAKYALEYGISTTQSTIEKVGLPKNSFDAVVINHTLEHLNSPKDVLKKVHDSLKESGLVLVDVPNFSSLSAKLWKDNWQYLLPQEHKWHFTFRALEQLLHNAGFIILEKSMPSGIWDYGNSPLEVWQAFRGVKKRFFMDFITAIPSLFVTLFEMGTSLTVLARKK